MVPTLDPISAGCSGKIFFRVRAPLRWAHARQPIVRTPSCTYPCTFLVHDLFFVRDLFAFVERHNTPSYKLRPPWGGRNCKSRGERMQAGAGTPACREEWPGRFRTIGLLKSRPFPVKVRAYSTKDHTDTATAIMAFMPIKRKRGLLLPLRPLLETSWIRYGFWSYMEQTLGYMAPPDNPDDSKVMMVALFSLDRSPLHGGVSISKLALNVSRSGPFLSCQHYYQVNTPYL